MFKWIGPKKKDKVKKQVTIDESINDQKMIQERTAGLFKNRQLTKVMKHGLEDLEAG